MIITNLFKKLPALESERVLLRPVSLNDTKDIFELLSEPEVVRYTRYEHLKKITDAQIFIRQILACYQSNSPSLWGLCHKSRGKVIGLAGFVTWSISDARAELSSLLSKSFWGQGYSSEATLRMLLFGFDVMGLNRIEAHCMPENDAACKVLEKVGMTYEGTLRDIHFLRGKYYTLRLYSILRSEWEAQHNMFRQEGKYANPLGENLYVNRHPVSAEQDSLVLSN